MANPRFRKLQAEKIQAAGAGAMAQRANTTVNMGEDQKWILANPNNSAMVSG